MPQHQQATLEELAHSFEDEKVEVDLHVYAFEDWVTLVVFWLMAACVFVQFFTRYVLNNSYAWTEEIAINGLVMVVFLGSIMCVRISRHIQVDIIYKYLPKRVARVLATIVDLIQITFFAYACWLMWRYTSVVANERMVTINLPRNLVFYSVMAGFVMMLLRSIQVFIQNQQRGFSALERPEAFENIGD